MNPRSPRHAFTLIELLVVVAVIGVIVGITIPALSHSRESARRVKCLNNLRQLGQSLVMYMDSESGGIMPRARPLHGGGPGGGNDPSLLDILADYVDAPVPRKEEGGDYFIVSDPYRCPSDRVGTDAQTGFEPVYRTIGTSYEYLPGLYMDVAEVGLNIKRAAFAVTRAYEIDRNWVVFADWGDWHEGRADGPGRNAVYFGDWRADWATEPTTEEFIRFIDDLRRIGGVL